MKPLRIAALAQDELREAADWYDERAPGLGRRFVDAIDAVCAGIAENPGRFRLVHRDVRRTVVDRFPYGIFFRERVEDILVIAIVHLHRHPDTWHRRV